ncbi:hypothetical protein [Methylobacterium pseudosasicola]|uniref:Uncharacterized protein n=1 Tax=Methylobacterium pseudosasicola TaxID=582667 RepID=A0A1I4U480_9HYPH|nr:hypothetical protein [Methylobacterium pseudosasicola]SFM83818.1 hypothetical protein SAMN05192568_10637 [Methylobacterium pseudosasicola]
MASRVSTGFHRIGLVLAAPLAVLSLGLLAAQWQNPTGGYKPHVRDEGMMAWKPERSDLITRSLRLKQEEVGAEAPPGFIIIGKTLRKEKAPTGVQAGAFNDLVMGVPEWVVFQLRDGREVSIGTTDENVAFNAATDFLYREDQAGRPFTDKDKVSSNGVRIAFLNPFNQFQTEPWPIARPADTPRSMDWFLAALAMGAAVTVYLSARALGWIVDGFAKPAG